jgi:hypothetical protein
MNADFRIYDGCARLGRCLSESGAHWSRDVQGQFQSSPSRRRATAALFCRRAVLFALMPPDPIHRSVEGLLKRIAAKTVTGDFVARHAQPIDVIAAVDMTLRNTIRNPIDVDKARNCIFVWHAVSPKTACHFGLTLTATAQLH